MAYRRLAPIKYIVSYALVRVSQQGCDTDSLNMQGSPIYTNNT